MAGAVLVPYSRLPERASWLTRAVLGVALIGVATFYGLMIAILPPQLLVVPLVPILLIAGGILWVLPDMEVVYDGAMDRLMCWYVAVNVLWPAYIAVDLPGLPWVTPTRIAAFSLVLVVLYNLATSSQLRGRMAHSLDGVPILRRLFWVFWFLTTISIVLSKEPFFSMNKYINNQIFWTMMCAVAAFLATRPGFVMRVSRIIVWTCMIIAVLGIYEYYAKRVFWLDHLPGFLKVDPEYLERIMTSQARAGTDIYRTKATFATSLTFAEYLAMVFPLVIHFTVKARGFWRFAALAFGVCGVIVAMYLTNARSAMVGLLLAVVLYVLFVAVRARVRNPASIGASATLFAYPLGVGVLALIVVFWQRAHVMVLGGGAAQASSETRKVQWAMGWEKFLQNPIGHGTNMGGRTLQYYNAGGQITIDTYYLNLLLEYGILGLVVYVLLFALPGWFGFRAFVAAKTEEEELAGPLAIGLVNYIIIKSVLSSEINVPIAFTLLGLLIGLIWRQRENAIAAQPAAVSTTPIDWRRQYAASAASQKRPL